MASVFTHYVGEMRRQADMAVDQCVPTVSRARRDRLRAELVGWVLERGVDSRLAMACRLAEITQWTETHP